MVVTVRTGDCGVTIRVNGRVDDIAARAMTDAVRVAIDAGDDATIELRSVAGLTSSAVRELAVCAHLGAQLYFVGPGREHSRA
jgi:hypothetical protein